MTLITRARTPMTDQHLVRLVHSTLWYLDVGSMATSVLVPVLALEHGAGADKRAPVDGRAAWNLWCWNYGNRRGHKGDVGQYVMTAPELIDGESEDITGAWPAWSSRYLGMVSWVETLQRDYTKALTAAESGDLYEACKQMKLAHYYTATLADYYAGADTWSRLMRKGGVL
jgi:hypothetical protein